MNPFSLDITVTRFYWLKFWDQHHPSSACVHGVHACIPARVRACLCVQMCIWAREMEIRNKEIRMHLHKHSYQHCKCKSINMTGIRVIPGSSKVVLWFCLCPRCTDLTVGNGWYGKHTLIAKFMGPTWGPHGAGRTQVGPLLATWTLLSGLTSCSMHSTKEKSEKNETRCGITPIDAWHVGTSLTNKDWLIQYWV